MHHRSKEELLHQISLAGHEHALALCEAAVGDTEDPRTQLVRLVRDFVRHHALNHTVGRIVNYELAGLTPEHRAQIDVMRRRMDAIVRDLVLRGVEAGAFHTPEPAMTGAAILSLGIDVSRWFDHERGRNPDQVAEHYCELVLRMVGDSGSSPAYVAHPRGQGGEVVLPVAEEVVEHRQVRGDVADDVLRGHRDAAVQLDRLLADVSSRAADLQRCPGGRLGDLARRRRSARTIVAQSTMLRVSSRETYMSAARKVSAWKVLRVTPNCLRLFR